VLQACEDAESPNDNCPDHAGSLVGIEIGRVSRHQCDLGIEGLQLLSGLELALRKGWRSTQPRAAQQCQSRRWLSCATVIRFLLLGSHRRRLAREKSAVERGAVPYNASGNLRQARYVKCTCAILSG